VTMLATIGRRFAGFGGVLVLEPLKAPENGEYPLRSLSDADAVRRRVLEERGVSNIALLFDSFHLAGNGAPLEESFLAFSDVIGHVQYADFPGRGAPGTGSIDFPSLTGVIEASGYDGYIGCEFLLGDAALSHDDLLRSLEGRVAI
jgi:hydroxypyruvate isomerase